MKKLSYLYVSLVWRFVDFQSKHTKNTYKSFSCRTKNRGHQFQVYICLCNLNSAFPSSGQFLYWGCRINLHPHCCKPARPVAALTAPLQEQRMNYAKWFLKDSLHVFCSMCVLPRMTFKFSCLTGKHFLCVQTAIKGSGHEQSPSLINMDGHLQIDDCKIVMV